MTLVVRRHWHAAQAYSRGSEDCIAYGRRKANEAGFARTGRGQILAIEKHDLHLRRVTETRHLVFGEERILDAAVAEENPFKQRAADRLHDRALHLVAQSIGIHDRAGFPGLDDAANLTCFVAGSMVTSAHVATNPPLSVPHAMP